MKTRLNNKNNTVSLYKPALLILIALVLMPGNVQAQNDGFQHKIMNALPEGSLDNWSTFHLGGGMMYAKVRNSKVINKVFGLKPASTKRMIVESFILTTAWEFYEFKGEGRSDIDYYSKEIYGTKEHMVTNNLMDIVVGMVGAILVTVEF